jgi:hypothetical protein
MWTAKKLLIWGKTYPEFSKRYFETVCTGAVDGETGKLLRIYPITLRYAKEPFTRYQWIEAQIEKNPKDSAARSHATGRRWVSCDRSRSREFIANTSQTANDGSGKNSAPSRCSRGISSWTRKARRKTWSICRSNTASVFSAKVRPVTGTTCRSATGVSAFMGPCPGEENAARNSERRSHCVRPVFGGGALVADRGLGFCETGLAMAPSVSGRPMATNVSCARQQLPPCGNLSTRRSRAGVVP